MRFLSRFCVEEGKRIRGLDSDALALLTTYDWPGNVRQLENAIFRAVVLADGDELTTAEFPRSQPRSRGTTCAFRRRRRRSPPIRRLSSPYGRSVSTITTHSLRLINDSGDVRMLEEIETEAIRFALAHYRGQMSQMARKLGIGRSTLYRKIKDIGIGDAGSATLRHNAGEAWVGAGRNSLAEAA